MRPAGFESAIPAKSGCRRELLTARPPESAAYENYVDENGHIFT